MNTFTIGQLAKKAQVNIETVRYYEKRGLMPRPKRTKSGYRQYTENDIKRLIFIKRAKELGFTLKEIFELLSLKIDAGITCGDVKELALGKISSVEEKIHDLQRIKKVLEELVESCVAENATISECPILKALEIEKEIK